MRICVYCSSYESIDSSFKNLAAEVGTRLASDGHSLVSGGGRVSMMGAVAQAARAGGARTVGVIPEHLVSAEVADADADELVVVRTMRERKLAMDDRSDAFLVLPGGVGTLEEMFEMWTSRALGVHDRPVVVLDPDGFYDPLRTFLDGIRDAGFVRQQALDIPVRARTVDEAFAALVAPAS